MEMSNYAPSKYDLFWIYACFAARIIVILATGGFLTLLLGYNPAKWLASHSILNMTIILLLIASIFMLAFERNFYLSFLGWSVYPCGSLAEKVPVGATIAVPIKVKPNSNVIYWATEPSTTTSPSSTSSDTEPISNPWDAYANYDNSGVVKSDAGGNAVLRVRSPSSYRVGLFNRKLNKHIHYRVCNQSGMLGEVKTVYI
jgi:hypothetical protein